MSDSLWLTASDSDTFGATHPPEAGSRRLSSSSRPAALVGLGGPCLTVRPIGLNGPRLTVRTTLTSEVPVGQCIVCRRHPLSFRERTTMYDATMYDPPPRLAIGRKRPSPLSSAQSHSWGSLSTAQRPCVCTRWSTHRRWPGRDTHPAPTGSRRSHPAGDSSPRGLRCRALRMTHYPRRLKP
jgi:hypothetical protein